MIIRKQNSFWAGLFLIMASMLLVCTSSCKKASVDGADYRDYLGDYSYDSSIVAMVYEDFNGEGYGILYREVKDYTQLVTKSPVPVLVYFYTSMHTEYTGTTAGVEQMAEDWNDRLLVVSVDLFQEGEIASHYEVQAVPDFVILKQGLLSERFDSVTRGTWTTEELKAWVEENIAD